MMFMLSNHGDHHEHSGGRSMKPAGESGAFFKLMNLMKTKEARDDKKID